jgi:hypothetical protein
LGTGTIQLKALPSVSALVRWPTMIPALTPIAETNGPIESLAPE